MKRNSSLKFKDICNSEFGGFVRVIWNGKEIYNDIDWLDSNHEALGVYIEGQYMIPESMDIIKDFINKYSEKSVYNFYCRVVDYHHTELYIEGEN